MQGVPSFPADQEAKEGTRDRKMVEKRRLRWRPKKEHEMDPSGKSVIQAAVGVTEGVEELAGSIGQTMDSAAQAVQDTLRRTKRGARDAMISVTEGIQTSTDYLTDRGMVGVVKDVETLIRSPSLSGSDARGFGGIPALSISEALTPRLPEDLNEKG